MAKVQKTYLGKIYERITQGDDNDIRLVFQDGSSSTSKICLTALSPYFEAMLTNDMLEKNDGVVKLPTVSKTTFDDVQRFHFLGEDIVNDGNWFILLDVADMLQLNDLKSLCIKYLDNNLTLTAHNCIHMWRSLKVYGSQSENLVKKIFQYVIINLEELSNSRIFTDLRTDEYLQVLSQDHLLQKEDEIIRDVQTWIKKNNPSVETMVDLFNQIRFEHVSIGYLKDDVLFTTFVDEHEELRKVVQEGIKRHNLYKVTNGFVDNRISGKLCDVMFVLQNSPTVLSVVFLTEKRWHKLPACCSEPGYCFSVATLGKSIYITGGSSQEQSTIVYNVLLKKWSWGPDLKHKRQNHCMTSLGETLYVIGGVHSNTIEELQAGHKEWEVVGDLGCRRQGSCAEAVGENILVMGGRIADRLHCFNTKTHTVRIINLEMKSAVLTRSYLEMPNLYLLHYGGEVDIIHVDDVNTPTLTAERVAEYDKLGYHFGFVYKDDSIIVVSNQGLQKLNIRDGSEESLSFDNTLQLCYIYGTTNMQVPRFCLL